MKIIAQFVLILVFTTNLISQNWESIPMHGGGYVVGITAHPTDANTVFARIDVGGIYKSTDQGDNWTNITQTIPLLSQRHFQVRSMLIDPSDPDKIYFVAGNAAYDPESAFWWTANGGLNWTKTTIPTHANGNHFGRSAGELLSFDPNDSSKIYLAGVPHYNNGTWQDSGGLYSTDNKGETWTRLDGATFNTTWFHDIKFKKNNANKLLLAASNFKESWMTSSTNNEGLWEYDLTTQSLTQLRSEATFEFDFDAVDANTIIAIWEDGIHISEDAGATWTLKKPIADYNYRYFVTPHPTEGGHWFFGYWKEIYQNGILETTDGGQSFKDVTYSSGGNNAKLTYPSYAANNQNPNFANASSCFTFSPVNNNIVYTGDWWGVWRSTDANSDLANDHTNNFENSNWSWTWTTKGIRNLVQLRASKHSSIEGQFYNCVADIGYYKVTDFGATAEHKTAIPISNIYKIAFEKNNPLVGYAVGLQFNQKGRIVKTIDGGDNWFEPSSGQQYSESYFETQNSAGITDIQIAGNATKSLIVGIEKGSMPSQIYRSDDHGDTFYAWSEGLPINDLFKIWTSIDHIVQSADGQTFYTWYTNQFYKRGLDDPNWQAITPPAGVDKWIYQIITHPTDANTLYLTQYGFGIYKSTDAGQTWTNLPMGGSVNAELAISPDGQQLAVVDRYHFGTDYAQQIYYTLDEGLHWNTIETSDLYTPATGIDFLSNTKMIAWTEGTGSFTYDLTQNSLSETGNLFDKIEGIIDNNPGDTGNDFVAPNAGELDIWQQVLQDIWTKNIAGAAQKAATLKYDLVGFIADTGEAYYILASQRINGNHWGTFVFNPNACQTNLVIQSPHPHNDTNTGLQGIYAFEQTGAYCYMVAGTHRCNNTAHSGCSGTTSTCGISGEDFRISDMAHTDISAFHRTTEFLLTTLPDPYFMQLHGFGWNANDPYLILSNSTTIAPPEDKLSQLGDILVAIDPTLTYEVAHINTGIKLKGTTNTQGRLINNSADACEVAATSNSGRFFHIEQERTKLRLDETGWQKMATALDKLFRNIDFDNQAIATGTYRAKDTLQSKGIVTTNSTVALKAGACILLKAGFETTIGSEFSATIESCANLSAKPAPIASTPIVPLSGTKNQTGFQVYPNPAQQSIHIQFTLDQAATFSIYLYNSMGQETLQITPIIERAKGDYYLEQDVTSVQPGIYYLLADGGVFVPVKVVIGE